MIHPGTIAAAGSDTISRIESAHAALIALAAWLRAGPEIDAMRFRAVFGVDCWRHKLDGLTLIGLAPPLVESGRLEASHSVWLRRTLGASSGPIGLFIQRPWYRDDIRGTLTCVLAETLAKHDLRFIASGESRHLQALAAQGADHAWMPAIDNSVPKGLTLAIGDDHFHHVDGATARLQRVTHRASEKPERALVDA